MKVLIVGYYTEDTISSSSGVILPGCFKDSVRSVEEVSVKEYNS